MGQLKKWLKEDWVRIDSSGNIAGECGSSKKKKEGSKGKQFVSNTPKAKVTKAKSGGRCMRDGIAIRGRTKA